MLPPKRILFPVDYSEPCQGIVPYVADFLERFPADLTLLHAYGSAIASDGMPVLDPSLVADLRAVEEQRLAAFAASAFPRRKVCTTTRMAAAETAVHDLLKRDGTDLIMLATHGHGPVRKFLLGSVAAKILHDVDCAVWVAPAASLAGTAPHIPGKNVLCAVDGEEAPAVLHAGSLIARAWGAELSLVHVVETPVAALEVDYAPFRDELLRSAEVRMRGLKASAHLDIPHSILEGGVTYNIREEALRRKADLIVTGRGRIRGTLGRFWAHLYDIVHSAPCPVLSL